MQIELTDFTYLTRIHYRAESDAVWGEHEIDYILFIQKDVPCTPNVNEVMECKYVDQEELRDLLSQGKKGAVKVTPWFSIICEAFLFKWWNSLDDLKPHIDQKLVHRMID